MKFVLAVFIAWLICVIFLFSVITISAYVKVGIPNFKENMPTEIKKGKWKPFAGLTTRFNAFGGKTFNFPLTFRNNKLAYIIARLMAMYVDYFTLDAARTYGVIWGIRKEEK